MGYSQLQQGHPAAAIPLFAEALTLDPHSNTADGNLRLALAMVGRYDEAKAGVPPTRLADVLNNIAIGALSRGDTVAARAFLAQALDISPTYHRKAAENMLRLNATAGHDDGER